jgi:hypothetical protein
MMSSLSTTISGNPTRPLQPLEHSLKLYTPLFHGAVHCPDSTACRQPHTRRKPLPESRLCSNERTTIHGRKRVLFTCLKRKTSAATSAPHRKRCDTLQSNLPDVAMPRSILQPCIRATPPHPGARRCTLTSTGRPLADWTQYHKQTLTGPHGSAAHTNIHSPNPLQAATCTPCTTTACTPQLHTPPEQALQLACCQEAEGYTGNAPGTPMA